jgi:hypothetical protein
LADACLGALADKYGRIWLQIIGFIDCAAGLLLDSSLRQSGYRLGTNGVMQS